MLAGVQLVIAVAWAAMIWALLGSRLPAVLKALLTGGASAVFVFYLVSALDTLGWG